MNNRLNKYELERRHLTYLLLKIKILIIKLNIFIVPKKIINKFIVPKKIMKNMFLCIAYGINNLLASLN